MFLAAPVHRAMVTDAWWEHLVTGTATYMIQRKRTTAILIGIIQLRDKQVHDYCSWTFMFVERTIIADHKSMPPISAGHASFYTDVA